MFNNFGPAYIINLKRREDRKNILIQMFKEYNINNYIFIDAIDANDEINHLVENFPSDNITKQEMAVMMSHLKAIKYWLDNSDSEYAIILEDDIDFELSKYWNFTWNDLIKSININYDVLQLASTYVRNDHTLKIHKRKRYEYGASFYLITRDHAQKLINKYFIEEKYNFLYNDNENIADDNSIFNTDKCYSIPLLSINPELGTDNISKPDVSELFENENFIKQQRINFAFLSQKILTEMWQKNKLSLTDLLVNRISYN